MFEFPPGQFITRGGFGRLQGVKKDLKSHQLFVSDFLQGRHFGLNIGGSHCTDKVKISYKITQTRVFLSISNGDRE